MCGNHEAFYIKFGDNSLVAIKRKGRGRIQTKAGQNQYNSDVLYVPDLKTNLLSV